MSNLYVRNIIRFILLILFQVLIFDNIQFRGYINPYVYIAFILMLPFETPNWLLIILSFITGITVDFFSDTLGIHSAACTLMAFSRPGILRMISSPKDYEIGITPSIRDLGFSWFFKYTSILTLIHHAFYFYLEVFTFHEFIYTFSRTLFSSLFTILFIIIGHYMFFSKNKM